MEKQKRYKALMLDLDGTTIPIKPDGVPSKKVKDAIHAASKKVAVGLATSRPFHYMHYLLNHLTLSAPCIINGGSEIIDPTTEKVISQAPIKKEDVAAIYELAKGINFTLRVDFHDRGEEFTSTMNLENVLSAHIPYIPEKIADEFIAKARNIPTISLHKMPSGDNKTQFISMNHVTATKQHGVVQVAEMLGISTKEMIGVGDGHNDLPLLMACGLRVAMGNAPEDLKSIADYIAPNFEEDGVANVIERFIV